MILFWIAASAANIAADNSNGTKTILAYRVNTPFINGKLAVINDPRNWEILLFD